MKRSLLRTGENWLSIGLTGSVHTTSPTAIIGSPGRRTSGIIEPCTWENSCVCQPINKIKEWKLRLPHQFCQTRHFPDFNTSFFTDRMIDVVWLRYHQSYDISKAFSTEWKDVIYVWSWNGFWLFSYCFTFVQIFMKHTLFCSSPLVVDDLPPHNTI
jgi:hypothetical protein